MLRKEGKGQGKGRLGSLIHFSGLWSGQFFLRLIVELVLGQMVEYFILQGFIMRM